PPPTSISTLSLHDALPIIRLSTFHDTTPVGGPPDQPRFLNAAAELATTLAPEELLRALLAVEQQFGRVRAGTDAPRTLDLDLLRSEEHTSELQSPDHLVCR